MEQSMQRAVTRVGSGSPEAALDRVVVEAPLEIRVAGEPLAVVMRTPGAEADLVRGFLLTEGIVLNPAEIDEIAHLAGDEHRWEVRLKAGIDVDPSRFQRNFYATSSCGVCGKASIDAVRVTASPASAGPVVPLSVLARMPDAMRSAQAAFDETGGIHAAAMFDPGGRMVSVREDVGRHNAVDKLIGGLAGETWPLRDLVLVVSGRVSFEIVQKAAVAGIPMVCGVSAASSLAIELGEELGLTVVGFLRDGGCNIYCGPQRVV